jgi:hypothetical protein
VLSDRSKCDLVSHPCHQGQTGVAQDGQSLEQRASRTGRSAEKWSCRHSRGSRDRLDRSTRLPTGTRNRPIAATWAEAGTFPRCDLPGLW